MALTVRDGLVALLVIFVISRIRKLWIGLKSVNFTPGLRIPFAPMSIGGNVFPMVWWNPGIKGAWEWRKSAYYNHKHDVISIVPFIEGEPSFYTGSVNVMKQLLENESKTNLVKPQKFSEALRLWGDSLISSGGGDVWKRHRKVVGPAFTGQTYELVMRESINAYYEMVTDEEWEKKKEFDVPAINRFPHKLALVVIGRCGFRLPLPWTEEEEGVQSHGHDLQLVSNTTILRLAIPNWVYKLPFEGIRQIDITWKRLAVFMHELITTRQSEIRSSEVDSLKEGDIFSRLVAAMDADAKVGLSEQEVIGNTFAMMFAGHETTAQVLSATLGYLAIYQEEQERAFEEIARVLGDRDPTLDDLPDLVHVNNCFQEALRIFPAGVIITRDFTEDVIIKVEHPREEMFCFRKGNRITFDMIGIHHDPKVFPEPEKFKPDRWNDIPYGVISMYGLGPRTCLGRRFAEVEGVAWLSVFLRDWKLDIITKDGETREQYEERVMTQNKKFTLAFGVGPVDVKLTRRPPIQKRR